MKKHLYSFYEDQKRQRQFMLVIFSCGLRKPYMGYMISSNCHFFIHFSISFFRGSILISLTFHVVISPLLDGVFTTFYLMKAILLRSGWFLNYNVYWTSCRPLVGKIGAPCLREMKPTFFGHLVIDKLRHQMQRDMVYLITFPFSCMPSSCRDKKLEK